MIWEHDKQPCYLYANLSFSQTTDVSNNQSINLTGSSEPKSKSKENSAACRCQMARYDTRTETAVHRAGGAGAPARGEAIRSSQKKPEDKGMAEIKQMNYKTFY